MPILLAGLYQNRISLLRALTLPSLLSRLAWRPSALKMSTFQHPDYNIPITLPTGLSQAQLLAFPPFKSWLSTLQTSLQAQHTTPSHPFHADPYALRAVTVQAFDLFGRPPHARLGFVKLSARVANAAGETLPGAVFLRGPSVAVMVLLVPDDGGGTLRDASGAGAGAGAGAGVKEGAAGEEEEEEERYVLLTVQPRVAAGSLAFVELPAGMVDDDGRAFVGQAAREMEEELGMVIKEEELVDLTALALAREGETEGGQGSELANAMYPSPGACDEYMQIYLHERRVPREQLGEWAGKLTGLREHGEKITLKLVRMQDLWKEGARDAKCLAAVALWEGLRREGKI